MAAVETPEQASAEAVVELPEGSHKLETPWTFWFDKKQSKGSSSTAAYQENLRRVGTVRTVEEFWCMYAHILRPNELPKDSNYHVFRKDLIPMWESFPNGGCWILKVRKEPGTTRKNSKLGTMWEDLLIAIIGEAFEEPDVVGVALSIRPKEDLLSVWNRDNEKSPNVRFKIGEKLKEVLSLEDSAVVEYKDNSSSMKDQSTFRNAKPYIYAATAAAPGPGGAPEDGAEAASA